MNGPEWGRERVRSAASGAEDCEVEAGKARRLTMTREGPAQDTLVTANGLRLHVRQWGRVDASPVLLLHGLTGNAWEWDPIAASLANRYHVLAVDQRGHGASAWASDYAPDRMVEDIDAIVSAFGPGRLNIVGHSMGGIKWEASMGICTRHATRRWSNAS
jgi:pimeloyl-ACP methyl ester carboxylesterase